MCRECVNNTGDVRHNAYQRLYMVEQVTKKDLIAFEKGQPAQVRHFAALTPDLAEKMMMDIIESPEHGAVRVTDAIICLN